MADAAAEILTNGLARVFNFQQCKKLHPVPRDYDNARVRVRVRLAKRTSDSHLGCAAMPGRTHRQMLLNPFSLVGCQG